MMTEAASFVACPGGAYTGEYSYVLSLIKNNKTSRDFFYLAGTLDNKLI